MFLRSSSTIALILYVSSSGSAFAQTITETTLPEVVVTGNLLNANDLITPTTQYSGTQLKLRTQTTLGETLNTALGVSSSYFGPNASRPIIRGLDGDRIRILNNGGATVDASSLSYDHAVAIDPSSIERIDILRGPAALLYGGNAMGGVVNLIDNRIPRVALFDTQGGITGKIDLQASSANQEKNAAFSMESGNDKYTVHADVFNHSTKDLTVPVVLPCTQENMTTQAKHICNSASDIKGGALGGTVFFDKGYLGASSSTYHNTYGTVAEDEVTIDMRSKQHAIEGEVKGLTGKFQSIKGQFSTSDYAHTELDAGIAATTFKNKGSHFRLESRHAKLGLLEGVIGLQTEHTRFSADGAEAFAPHSKTRHTALFAYEELGLPWGRISFGGRLESASINSLGNSDIPRFFVGERKFTPKNYAIGTIVNLTPAWQATSNISWNQRAPKDYELYANGPHAATGVYEVGNPLFSIEKSINLEAGLQWKKGANRFNFNAFTNRFNNYIALESTGMNRDSDGNGGGFAGVSDCGDGNSVQSGCLAEVLPEFSYRPVKARFTGLEMSGTVRLLGANTTTKTSALDMELRGDLVHAKNLNTRTYLSRITPARVGASLVWTQGAWSSRIGFDRTAQQNRVPEQQNITAGYTLWNAAVTYRMKASRSNVLWFAKLENIGDKLAYSPTSILTQTALGKAPMPGRNVKLGVQMYF
jgi:iron complex outermembrane recepter protein